MLSLTAAPSSTAAFRRNPTLSTTPNPTFNGVVRIARAFPVPCSRSVRNPRSLSVVMMAKREEELKEIREKTTEEINDEIIDLKGELFMLRMNRSARNEFKSSEFRRMRKRVFPTFTSLASYFLANSLLVVFFIWTV